MSGFLCSMVGATYAVAVAEVIRRKAGIIAVGNAQISTAQSKFGGSSLALDGTGDSLKLDDAAFAFGTGDFTYECFVRPTDTGNFALFDGTTPTGSSNAITIWIDGTVKLYSGGWVGSSSGQGSLTNGTWYHIAVSRSAGTLQVFLNGTSILSTSNSTNFTQTVLQIGDARGGSYDGNGYMDEIRISNTARYTANFTAPTAPFVNDDNTLLLIHADGTNATTFFEDDNGVRAPKGIQAIGNAQVDTAQSKFGGASALFDGTDDYLVANTSEALTGNFTMECWFRAANISAGYRAILVLGNEATGRFVLYMNGSQIGCNLYALNTYDIVSSSAIAATTWYHITVVKNGSTQTLYLDGVSKGSVTAASSYGNTGGYYIGNLSTLTDDFNGHIDEIRVSNSARYTTTFTPSTTAFVNDANTLLLIHADGTDGSTVFRDDNGVRAPKGITAIGNAQVDTAQSKFGGASALFDGTGDYLSAPATISFGTGNFTWEAWVRLANDNADMNLFDGSANGDISIRRTNDGKLQLGRFFVAFDTASTAMTIANTWTHLAVSRSGSTVKLFKDGVDITSTGGTNTNSLGISSTAFIGDHPGYSIGVNGHMDEIRVSDIARYTTAFTPSTTPFQNDANTLLLIHCDGTDGSTVFTDDNGKTPT